MDSSHLDALRSGLPSVFVTSVGHDVNQTESPAFPLVSPDGTSTPVSSSSSASAFPRSGLPGSVAHVGHTNNVADSSSPPPLSLALHYVKPNMIDGRVVVCPPAEVLEEGCVFWRTALVGYFVGQKLPFKVVDSIAHKIWGRYGLHEVLSSDNGLFVFRFVNFQDACVVMKRRPWHMANRSLVLKHWQPDFILTKENVDKLPDEIVL